MRHLVGKMNRDCLERDAVRDFVSAFAANFNSRLVSAFRTNFRGCARRKQGTASGVPVVSQVTSGASLARLFFYFQVLQKDIVKRVEAGIPLSGLTK